MQWIISSRVSYVFDESQFVAVYSGQLTGKGRIEFKFDSEHFPYRCSKNESSFIYANIINTCLKSLDCLERGINAHTRALPYTYI